MQNEKKKIIPWLPVSALIFYLIALALWKFSIIPSPSEIVIFLENLYANYGLLGLFIAAFLEGIVYFGLYFPGSFLIVFSVILADGTFKSLILISVVVAIAITLTSIINYTLGRRLNKNSKDNEVKKIASRGLFLSMLHPNALAFYFLNEGMKKRNPLKIILVPILMIPYGLFHAVLITFFKEAAQKSIESPYVMGIYILVWLFLAFLINLKNEKNLS